MLQQKHGLCMGYKDADTLRRLYHESGMSLPEIGRKFKVDPSTVLYHMKKHGIERRRRPNDKPLSTRTNGHGYSCVVHQIDGKEHTVRIHRLIAVAEHGFDAVVNKDIHHKNGVKWDNRLENMELITRSEHMTLHNNERGEKMPEYGRKAHK